MDICENQQNVPRTTSNQSVTLSTTRRELHPSIESQHVGTSQSSNQQSPNIPRISFQRGEGENVAEDGDSQLQRLPIGAPEISGHASSLIDANQNQIPLSNSNMQGDALATQ